MNTGESPLFKDECEHGKSLLVRIVSMLTKLAQRFSPPTNVREQGGQYMIEDDDDEQGCVKTS
jgi:hypothetical protein